MRINVISLDGKNLDKIELSDKIFSLEPNQKVIKSVVDWQINRFKPRTAKTKQRNEVIGSTAKIYAQKGTGGARHSSRKAPIFVGGGVAHGPKGAVYKIKKINNKIKKLALLHALSVKNKFKSLVVVQDFKDEIKKTKIFYNFLNKNNLENVLIISDKNSKSKIHRSARNIPNLKIIDEAGTNVYDLLKYKNVMFTKSSIKNLESRLSKWRDLII